MVPAEQKSRIDLNEVLWSVRRKAWVALLPIVTALCGGVVLLMVTDPQYESRVTIALVEQPQVSEALEPLVRSNPALRRETYAVAVAKLDNILHSPPMLDAVVRRMGLSQDPELLAEGSAAARHLQGITAEEYATRRAASRIQEKIVVERVGPPYVRILTVDEDPALAQKLASTVAAVLIEESKKASVERSQQRGAFSADQIALYEEKLRESESALRAFQESMIARQSSSSPVTAENLEVARTVVRATGEEVDQVRNRLESEIAEWRSQSREHVSLPVLRSQRSGDLERRLIEFEVSHGLAVLGDAAGGNEASALRLNIGAARQTLFSEYEELSRGLQGGWSEVARGAAAGVALDRSILRSLESKRERINELISDHLRELKGSPRQQMELERLRGEVQMNRELLLALRKEASSSQISAAMDTRDLSVGFEVVEAAQLPLAPVSPDPVKILGAALMFGALLSAGAVIAGRRTGATLQTVEQAEGELGVAVIGTVPRIEGWRRPGNILQRRWAELSIAFVLLVTLTFWVVHSTLVADRPSARRTAESAR